MHGHGQADVNRAVDQALSAMSSAGLTGRVAVLPTDLPALTTNVLANTLEIGSPPSCCLRPRPIRVWHHLAQRRFDPSSASRIWPGVSATPSGARKHLSDQGESPDTNRRGHPRRLD